MFEKLNSFTLKILIGYLQEIIGLRLSDEMQLVYTGYKFALLDSDLISETEYNILSLADDKALQTVVNVYDSRKGK